MFIQGRVFRRRQGFGGAEGPHKGAINGIGGAGMAGMHAQADVMTIGPMLPTLAIHQIGFGAKESGFGQG